jgi:hypothetical protein
MAIPELLSHFGTEEQCTKVARWLSGFRCPRCNLAEHYVVGHGARKLFQRNGCRHQRSARALRSSLIQHKAVPLPLGDVRKALKVEDDLLNSHADS